MKFQNHLHTQFHISTWKERCIFVIDSSYRPQNTEPITITRIETVPKKTDEALYNEATEATLLNGPDALEKLQEATRTYLKSKFKKFYKKYEQDTPEIQKELHLRVENIIEKLNHIVPEAKDTTNTLPITLNTYKEIVRKYHNGVTQQGDLTINAFSNEGNAFLHNTNPPGSILEIKQDSTERTPLNNWLTDQKYIFKKAPEGLQGTEIYQEKGTPPQLEFITYVPRGIINIWPIQVNGDTKGFVIQDGDGDMASILPDGSMHFLEAPHTEASPTITEKSIGTPQEVAFDQTKEVGEQRSHKAFESTIQQKAEEIRNNVTTEVNNTLAQTQAEPSIENNQNPSNETDQTAEEPPTPETDSNATPQTNTATTTEDAPNQESGETPASTTPEPETSPIIPNLDKLPHEILEALNTLNNANLLDKNNKAILKVNDQGKITEFKLSSKTSAETPETRKALFTIANHYQEGTTPFPPLYEKILTQLFIGRNGLINWKLGIQNKILENNEKLLFKELPQATTMRIWALGNTWNLKKEGDHFEATPKKTRPEHTKTAVHGIRKKNNQIEFIKINEPLEEGAQTQTPETTPENTTPPSNITDILPIPESEEESELIQKLRTETNISENELEKLFDEENSFLEHLTEIKINSDNKKITLHLDGNIPEDDEINLYEIAEISSVEIITISQNSAPTLEVLIKDGMPKIHINGSIPAEFDIVGSYTKAEGLQ